jgi:hypothetical protein
VTRHFLLVKQKNPFKVKGEKWIRGYLDISKMALMFDLLNMGTTHTPFKITIREGP